jgi:hypothetical protein
MSTRQGLHVLFQSPADILHQYKAVRHHLNFGGNREQQQQQEEEEEEG